GLVARRVDRDPSPVGLLPATFGVEGGRVEDQLDLVALAGTLEQTALADQGGDACLAHHLAVSGELARTGLERCAVAGEVAVPDLLALRVLLAAATLLGHEAAKPVLVDADALLGRHLQGDLDREAVR